MAERLNIEAGDFEERFKALLETKREISEDVDAVVRHIVADVRARGDAGLKELTLKFDQLDLDQVGIRIHVRW